MKPESSSVLYPGDVESLILSHFVRSLMIAMREHRYPRSYFQSLGIEIPSSLERWTDINLDDLLGCTGVIVSSGKKLNLYENLSKPRIIYEEKES